MRTVLERLFLAQHLADRLARAGARGEDRVVAEDRVQPQAAACLR
jgi:hypothetical protein